jgi:hypothetical protein
VRVASGLGAIQLAATLGWMACAHFQPRILDDIGLSRLDTLLSVYVAAAGTMLGPLAGGLADLTLLHPTTHGAALALNLDCALPVAFGGSSGLRTGLTAGLYLGGVMAGTEAALLLVPGSG